MKPPAFQFYVDDFIGGVADMTQAEVGAYILLLCNQWNRGEIPPDAERAALVAKGPVTPHVLAKFPGGKNARMEFERANQAAWREKQRAAGIASGRARREHSLNGGSTVVEHSLNERSTNVEPNTQPNANQNELSTLHSPTPISTHTPAFAERPSLEEVKTAAKFIGLAPWKAEDWFNEMEGGGWLDYNHRPVVNWRAVLNRVKAKWEAEGRPASPPSGKLNGKPGVANAAPRIGPSLAAVQEYARDKDDGSKRALGYAVSWWQAWEGRGWKRDGKSIDWQIEFAKAVQGHLQRQST